MKQSRIHTNNPLQKKLSYQLLLRQNIALRKLIKAPVNPFDESFFTKCLYLIFIPLASKSEIFAITVTPQKTGGQ